MLIREMMFLIGFLLGGKIRLAKWVAGKLFWPVVATAVGCVGLRFWWVP
jgi:hypothetical protein